MFSTVITERNHNLCQFSGVISFWTGGRSEKKNFIKNIHKKALIWLQLFSFALFLHVWNKLKLYLTGRISHKNCLKKDCAKSKESYIIVTMTSYYTRITWLCFHIAMNVLRRCQGICGISFKLILLTQHSVIMKYQPQEKRTLPIIHGTKRA